MRLSLVNKEHDWLTDWRLMHGIRCGLIKVVLVMWCWNDLAEWLTWLCRLEESREFERAAAIAVFMLKVTRAIEVLRHGATWRQNYGTLYHSTCVSLAKLNFNISVFLQVLCASVSVWCLPTALASEVMQSPPSICPPVCFHSFFRTNWPSTLNFCMWVDHDHNSQRIES